MSPLRNSHDLWIAGRARQISLVFGLLLAGTAANGRVVEASLNMSGQYDATISVRNGTQPASQIGANGLTVDPDRFPESDAAWLSVRRGNRVIWTGRISLQYKMMWANSTDRDKTKRSFTILLASSNLAAIQVQCGVDQRDAMNRPALASFPIDRLVYAERVMDLPSASDDRCFSPRLWRDFFEIAEKAKAQIERENRRAIDFD